MGNFLADLMRTEFETDVALLSMGTVRLNERVSGGLVTLRLLTQMLPFPDKVTVVSITGAVLKLALENAVSKYPALDGRWPAISNLEMQIDPSQPEGKRIISLHKRGPHN